MSPRTTSMGPNDVISDVIFMKSLMKSLGRNDVIAMSQRRHQSLQFDYVLITSHRHNDVIDDGIKTGVQLIQPSIGQSRP